MYQTNTSVEDDPNLGDLGAHRRFYKLHGWKMENSFFFCFAFLNPFLGGGLFICVPQFTPTFFREMIQFGEQVGGRKGSSHQVSAHAACQGDLEIEPSLLQTSGDLFLGDQSDIIPKKSHESRSLVRTYSKNHVFFLFNFYFIITLLGIPSKRHFK